MSDLVLVDTSAWIEFLRSGEHRDLEVSGEVRRLIESDRAVITEPVFLEIAVGAKGKKQLDEWREFFSVLRLASVERETWLQSIANGYKLARGGINAPVVDLLLATLALEHGLAILHREEKHFPRMAPVLGFQEYDPRKI